jgi:hypothetical protein
MYLTLELNINILYDTLLTKVKKKEKKKSSPNFHLQGSNVLIKLMVENKRASHETQKNI